MRRQQRLPKDIPFEREKLNVLTIVEEILWEREILLKIFSFLFLLIFLERQKGIGI